MTFGFATYGLALIAGALSTLSPCVLPLIPVLVASAVDAHRWGVFALGAGLAVSYSLIGIFLATAGASIGIDPESLRVLGAVLLALVGILLLSQQWQYRFANVTAGVAQAGHSLLSSVSIEGFKGQFLVGLLLGLVWSPCVGPTLGAATTLASQGRDLVHIALLMVVFSAGASLPLVVLGSLSRATLLRIRGKLLLSAARGRQLLGCAMLIISALILTKLDKSFEAWILDHSPDWLTRVTTAF